MAHLYRLGALLAAALIAFLIVVKVVTPASWNYEDWYRGDVLVDNAAKPLRYGGITEIAVSKRNDSCRTCHENEIKKVEKLDHRSVSCEVCHGALWDHAQDGKKVAVAHIDKSTWQCLNCHDELISRPKDFPQFTDEVKKHRTLEEGTVCLKCHDAHDPTP
jgi:hypothetical protein